MALEWELKFINFMHNWIENEKPDFFDVSFYTSRSLQDELNKASYGDVDVICKLNIIIAKGCLNCLFSSDLIFIDADLHHVIFG